MFEYPTFRCVGLKSEVNRPDFRVLAQSGSAFALGAKGRRFESFIPDQNWCRIINVKAFPVTEIYEGSSPFGTAKIESWQTLHRKKYSKVYNKLFVEIICQLSLIKPVARLVELVDTLDLGSSAERRKSSSLLSRTKD